MRRSAVVVLLVFFVALSACSRVAVQTTSADNDKDLITDPVTCSRRLEVTAELAIPGEIAGFDCYNADGNLEFLYRESNDNMILSMAENTWISTPGSPLFTAGGDGWFVLANQENRVKIELKEEVKEGTFKELTNTGEAVSDPYSYDEETCSQFAAAIIYDYVVEGTPLPGDLSPEAREILVDDYSDLRTTSTLDDLDPNSPDIRVLLGNRSQRINQYCSDGHDIYGSS